LLATENTNEKLTIFLLTES